MAAAKISANSITWVVVPPSVPPDNNIISGLNCLIRVIFSCGNLPSFDARTSITIDPAPNAALSALSPDIDFTTPATIICNPPPAELVET